VLSKHSQYISNTGVRIVSLLEYRKPKNHMDFGYTMKALRSKKKIG